MGMLGNGGMPGGLPPLAFEVKPRVFVRALGEEYQEIEGISSFERIDEEGGGAKISFTFAKEQDDAVAGLLRQDSDQYVDVKMEFLIGMLMVMTFSGFVEASSDGMVSFAVSTPIATDVLDIVQ